MYLQQLLDCNAAVDRRSVIQRMKMLDFYNVVKKDKIREPIFWKYYYWCGCGGGLFCAAQLVKLGKSVTVFDNGKKKSDVWFWCRAVGFSNFTNLEVTPAHYLSQNPHFVKSALARYTNWDFISLVAEQGITYHEKELGQLFTMRGRTNRWNAEIWMR